MFLALLGGQCIPAALRREGEGVVSTGGAKEKKSEEPCLNLRGDALGDGVQCPFSGRGV